MFSDCFHMHIIDARYKQGYIVGYQGTSLKDLSLLSDNSFNGLTFFAMEKFKQSRYNN